jgi:RNase P/RNase MRP subunit p30
MKFFIPCGLKAEKISITINRSAAKYKQTLVYFIYVNIIVEIIVCLCIIRLHVELVSSCFIS